MRTKVPTKRTLWCSICKLHQRITTLEAAGTGIGTPGVDHLSHFGGTVNVLPGGGPGNNIVIPLGVTLDNTHYTVNLNNPAGDPQTNWSVVSKTTSAVTIRTDSAIVGRTLTFAGEMKTVNLPAAGQDHISHYGATVNVSPGGGPGNDIVVALGAILDDTHYTVNLNNPAGDPQTNWSVVSKTTSSVTIRTDSAIVGRTLTFTGRLKIVD